MYRKKEDSQREGERRREKERERDDECKSTKETKETKHALCLSESFVSLYIFFARFWSRLWTCRIRNLYYDWGLEMQKNTASFAYEREKKRYLFLSQLLLGYRISLASRITQIHPLINSEKPVR